MTMLRKMLGTKGIWVLGDVTDEVWTFLKLVPQKNHLWALEGGSNKQPSDDQ